MSYMYQATYAKAITLKAAAQCCPKGEILLKASSLAASFRSVQKSHFSREDEEVNIYFQNDMQCQRLMTLPYVYATQAS